MATKKPTNGDTMRASALARKINTLMLDRKMTRQQFADASGISESTLSKMLSGKTNPHDSTLRYMEEKLGLPLAYFSKNIKNPVQNDAQCILEEPPKPEPKPPKRIILSWKSVSGEEEETEIAERPAVNYAGEVIAETHKGRITLFCDKLIWWSIEEV